MVTTDEWKPFQDEAKQNALENMASYQEMVRRAVGGV
jgi:hypothetical protein